MTPIKQDRNALGEMKNVGGLFRRPWETFFRMHMEDFLQGVKSIVDIGGGLRISGDRSNRLDSGKAWIYDLIQERGIEYKVLDYVDTYHPDIVGDVQNLPFADGTQEAVVCSAVLEHVENPIKAASELERVLKPGGRCFVYVPFLFYFHAEEGYYGDYWRFTKDTLQVLFQGFSKMEIEPVRGALETWIHLSPLGRYRLLLDLAFLVDRLTRKQRSNQTSGYYVFLVK